MPDIWPEISDQAKSIEDMMRVVWAKEGHCQQKKCRTKTITLSSSG